MANKRISDLTTSGTLSGDEVLVIDQPSTVDVSGFSTVKTTLSSIQEFTLSAAPFLDVKGDITIEGEIDVTGSLSASGDFQFASMSATNAVFQGSAEFLGETSFDGDLDARSTITSGGCDLSDLFGLGIGAVGNINQVTTNGNETTNSVCFGSVSANNFIASPDVNCVSVGDTSLSITGGLAHCVIAGNSLVGGGCSNYIFKYGGAGTFDVGSNSYCGDGFSTIAGGFSGNLSGAYNFIGSGYNNALTGAFGFLGSGRQLSATADWAVIAGGDMNCVAGRRGAVLGGGQNCVMKQEGVILGGLTNCVDANCGVILGGYLNKICCGSVSLIFGSNNEKQGTGSRGIIFGEANKIVANHAHTTLMGCGLTSVGNNYTVVNKLSVADNGANFSGAIAGCSLTIVGGIITSVS